MALPVVRTALECSDFYQTVLPYANQLRALPQVYFESITNPVALKQIYLDTNPLVTAFAFSLALAPIFLLVSEINKNYSQVDRVWSILPTVYNAHYGLYAHMMGMPTERLDAVFAASLLWSIRLTYNYARKGGYNIGSEDYRWEILREKISPPLFFLFHVFFISLAQSFLLWSITTPTYVLLLTSRIASANPGPDGLALWGLSDLIGSGIMVVMVLGSAVADEQQWNYQNAKKGYQQTAKVPAQFEQTDLDRGFVTKGLWAYSRHPNFAAEQTFWVILYQWSCLVTGSLWNWTAIGAVGYLILFQASTWFTELVTAKKYPDYKLYQKQVAKFYPRNLTPYKQSSQDTQGKTKTPTSDGQSSATASTEEQKRYNLRH